MGWGVRALSHFLASGHNVVENGVPVMTLSSIAIGGFVRRGIGRITSLGGKKNSLSK
jgi:hypothetical protein